MARFPALPGKFQTGPLQNPPSTPESRKQSKLLVQRSANKTAPSRVPPSNGAVADRIAGSKVSGGGNITGGKG